MPWRLDNWSTYFASKVGNTKPMTRDEQNAAVTYLKASKYERPEDCPMFQCPKYRPTCNMGVCVIAVKMCGD